MTSPNFDHVPVLGQRVRDLLAPALQRKGATFVDANVGLGGHMSIVLEAFPNVRAIGIDRDEDALQLCRERFASNASRVELVKAVNDELSRILSGLDIDWVDGVLFDSGVSSMQIDDRERGFTYAHDAQLDMRMDSSGELSAAVILNEYPEAAIAHILHIYGEERFARRIATGIVRSRESGPISSSGHLTKIIEASVPAAARRRGGHPAKRTFQALRIAVNDELTHLDEAVHQALDSVGVGGRVIALSYHSLEDRIVKKQFTLRTRTHEPHDLPLRAHELQTTFRAITRGAERASDLEVANNSRAMSARLRAVERIAA